MTTHVRRHNPYAFDVSSHSSSFESQENTTVVVRRTNPTTPSPFVPQGHTDASTFDVRSECSDDHYIAPQDPQFDSVVGATPEGYETHRHQHHQRPHHHCTDFDATEMNEILELAGHPVDIPCAPGVILTVYNSDISQHFNVPSEAVQVTRGSIKYADHHARYGPQTRFRFQLCHNYLQRKCTKLSECSYVHVTSLPRANEVHLNPFAPRRLAADRRGRGFEVPLSFQDDPNVVASYQTLPSGRTLKIYAPNDNGQLEPQLIPSEMIILTVGAMAAYGAGNSEHCHHRHCAHYQFKRLCNLGRECHFIHSKIPFAANFSGSQDSAEQDA